MEKDLRARPVPEEFKSQPAVMVALKRFDLGDAKASIHRIGVRAENPTTKGFDLYLETWYEARSLTPSSLGS
jgi:hypothetical protein